MTKLYILNQYYIDLIKKLKTIAKKHRDKSETAKKVFNIIKNNYLTLDKSSDEYITFIKTHLTNDLYNSYKELNFTEKKNEENKEEENQEEENQEEETPLNNDISYWLTCNQDVQILDNVTIKDILKIFRNEYLCHHYLSVFFIYSQDLSDEESEKILTILQKDNYTDDDITELEDEKDIYKKILLNLIKIKNIKIKKNVDMKMGGMENTTLGKLAKEILNDVDVNKLHKSMNKNGDVLKSLGDPDSGFGDIISNVSQKMAAKLSSGELNQENLMQDAMKFASMMPGMFGKQNQNSTGANNMANMGNMMNMFSEMMANNGDGDMPDLNTIKNMAKNKGGRTGVNEAAYKKLAAQKKLRKKLAEKNKNN
jgi:hypothetical protein